MNFGSMYFGMACAVWVTSAQGILLGCVAPDSNTANTAMPMTIIPFVLLCGFMVAIENITWALRWISYIDVFKWGIESMLTFEFEDRTYECESAGSCPSIAEAARCVDQSQQANFPNCWPREVLGNYILDEERNIDRDYTW